MPIHSSRTAASSPHPGSRSQLHAIVERGGRVIVVDPRRSETARAFEHVPIRPDADAWLLLSMLEVIFARASWTSRASGEQAVGVEALRRLVCRSYARDDRVDGPGFAADDVRQLARAFATARERRGLRPDRVVPRAPRHPRLVPARCAQHRHRQPRQRRAGRSSAPGRSSSRICCTASAPTATTRSARASANLPEILGTLPASIMAEEITTPGRGQIRALFVSSGNPVLSVPNGPELEHALGELDLMVAIDLYVNETSRHADYILPATTFLEREDFPAAFLTFSLTPYVQWTEAVLEPRGEARQEWEIIDEISRRIGITPASLWLSGRSAGSASSSRRASSSISSSGSAPKGDLFGLRRGGLSLAKLRRNPHGIRLGEHHADRRPAQQGLPPRQARPSRLAPDRRRGARRSSATRRPTTRLPAPADRDARAALPQLLDAQRAEADGRRPRPRRPRPSGRRARARDRGRRAVPGHLRRRRDRARGKITDEMTPGVIAIPHGWGHRSGGASRTAERGRRRERQRARLERPRRPRAARRDGGPQRDPGAARAGLR